MSADNWAAAEAYGKESAAEYERLRAEAARPVDPEDFRTFREDYEFYGAEGGVVTASYSGQCSVCSLGLDFRHEQRFYEAGSL